MTPTKFGREGPSEERPGSGIGALFRYVSLRYVLAAPLRSLLTLFGVALGVAMVVGMTSVNDAILSSFREMVDRAGGKADLEVTGDESGVPQSIVDQLVDQKQVAHVAGVLEKTTLIGRENQPLSQGERALVLGVDVLGDLALLPFERRDGSRDGSRDGTASPANGSGNDARGGELLVADPLAFINDPNAILLSETLAARLGVDVGGTVRMHTTNGAASFHVEGIVKETRKAKAFGGLVALMSLDAAQLAFGAQGDGGRVDRIDIALAPGVDAKQAQLDLGKLVEGRAELAPPARRGEQTQKMIQSLQVGLELSAGIAMLVGMFLIYNTISVAVAQRRRDLGILRAVGVTRRRVVSTVLAEGLVLSLVGGAVGVGLGQLLAIGLIRQVSPAISRFYQPIVAPPPRVSLGLALAGIGLGVVATLVAGYVPARRAARMSPVETLRRDLIATSVDELPVVKLAAVGVLGAASAPYFLEWALRRPGVPIVLPGYLEMGALVLGAACTMPLVIVLLHRALRPVAQRLLGLPGRLGVDNVVRALGRSSMTASALMLATCASVAIAGYAYSFRGTTLDWMEQSIPGDIFISAGSPLLDRNALSFDKDLVKKLAEPPIAGVAVIDTARNLRVQLMGRRIPVIALDTAFYFRTLRRYPSFRRVIEGDAELREHDLDQEPSLLLAENFARAFDLHAGQSIELPTPSGPQPFRIRAVVVDYSDEQGWAMLDAKFYRQFWRDDRIDMIKLFVGKDAEDAAAHPASVEEAERVADLVRARLAATSGDAADDGLFVVTAATLKAEIRQAIDETFKIGDVSQLIAFIVAVLGVVGTMLAAVLDRTREIGVLRAIGATRAQITRAVVAEASFLGLVSALVGVAVGVPAALVFTRVIGVAATGWNVPFRFPVLDGLRVALSILAVSAIAGWLPGRRASRMRVTNALAYE